MTRFLRYVVVGGAGLLVLAVLVAAPFAIKARSEADTLYVQYAAYTEDLLARHATLTPHPVKPEYQRLHPAKFLKLVNIAIDSRQGQRLARVNVLDATMLLCVRMYTLLIRPDAALNLPTLSADIIFAGGRRVFVLELIDPAPPQESARARCPERMRARQPEVATFAQSPTPGWYDAYLADCSIHITADRSRDEQLFSIYQDYLSAYLEMVDAAQPVPEAQRDLARQGMARYVDTLLANGGPAVDVFEQMLGPEGQREYVRTVMFGID